MYPIVEIFVCVLFSNSSYLIHGTNQQGWGRFQRHVIFFQTVGPQCDKKCFKYVIWGCFPSSMIPTPVLILNKSNQNQPGQPGGGSPGEGYLKGVQNLEPI